MSPGQLLKRALVSILLELARVYGTGLTLNRDAPDVDVKRAFRKVIIRVTRSQPKLQPGSAHKPAKSAITPEAFYTRGRGLRARNAQNST